MTEDTDPDAVTEVNDQETTLPLIPSKIAIKDNKELDADRVLVHLLSKRLARHAVSHISADLFDEIIHEARANMQVVEDVAMNELFDNEQPSGILERIVRGEERLATPTAVHLAEILAQRASKDMGRWIARECYKQLVDPFKVEEEARTEDTIEKTLWEMDDSDQLEADVSPDSVGSYGLSTSSQFTNSSADSLVDTELQRFMNDSHVSLWNAESSKEHLNSLNTDDPALRKEAFLKFKRVVVQGKGFRVLKHNSGGGKKLRTLKYKARQHFIYWQSLKMMGGDRIQCQRIVRVLREGKVVYVWHMSGSVEGSVKKVVGFETARECDAVTLGLALLYLRDHPLA